jgi:hypothetical protein
LENGHDQQDQPADSLLLSNARLLFDPGQLSPVPGTPEGRTIHGAISSAHIFQQDAANGRLVTNGHETSNKSWRAELTSRFFKRSRLWEAR